MKVTNPNVVNPLDPERSWPQRSHGLSNYDTRPQEIRTRDSESLTPDGIRQSVYEVWNARSLYREQVAAALEDGEYSPDSIIGLSDWIDEVRTNIPNADAAKKGIARHQEMLLWALRLYDKVPDSYKRDTRKGHPSLVQGVWTGERIINLLAETGFEFDGLLKDGNRNDSATPVIRYNWENAARMLRIVARYLDEVTRG